MERDSMETTPTTQTQLSTNTEEIKMKVSSTTPIVEQTVESSLLSYKEEELNAALSLSALSLPFIMRVSQIPLVNQSISNLSSAYQATKNYSNIVKYSAESVEQRLQQLTQPLNNTQYFAPLDRFACNQLDKLEYAFPAYLTGSKEITAQQTDTTDAVQDGVIIDSMDIDMTQSHSNYKLDHDEPIDNLNHPQSSQSPCSSGYGNQLIMNDDSNTFQENGHLFNATKQNNTTKQHAFSSVFNDSLTASYYDQFHSHSHQSKALNQSQPPKYYPSNLRYDGGNHQPQHNDINQSYSAHLFNHTIHSNQNQPLTQTPNQTHLFPYHQNQVTNQSQNTFIQQQNFTTEKETTFTNQSGSLHQAVNPTPHALHANQANQSTSFITHDNLNSAPSNQSIKNEEQDKNGVHLLSQYESNFFPCKESKQSSKKYQTQLIKPIQSTWNKVISVGNNLTSIIISKDMIRCLKFCIKQLAEATKRIDSQVTFLMSLLNKWSHRILGKQQTSCQHQESLQNHSGGIQLIDNGSSLSSSSTNPTTLLYTLPPPSTTHTTNSFPPSNQYDPHLTRSTNTNPNTHTTNTNTNTHTNTHTHLDTDDIATLSDVKQEIAETLRNMIGQVAKYSSACLSIDARQRVRGYIMHLPQRWASLNTTPDLNSPNSSGYTTPRTPPQESQAEEAEKMLLLARESSRVLCNIQGIFKQSLNLCGNADDNDTE